jgi:hypothetical protein
MGDINNFIKEEDTLNYLYTVEQNRQDLISDENKLVDISNKNLQSKINAEIKKIEDETNQKTFYKQQIPLVSSENNVFTGVLNDKYRTVHTLENTYKEKLNQTEHSDGIYLQDNIDIDFLLTSNIDNIHNIDFVVPDDPYSSNLINDNIDVKTKQLHHNISIILNIYKNIFENIKKQNNILINSFDYLNDEVYTFERKSSMQSDGIYYYRNILYYSIIIYFLLVVIFFYFLIYSKQTLYKKIFIGLVLIAYPFFISLIENIVFEFFRYLYCIIYGKPYVYEKGEQTLWFFSEISSWFQYQDNPNQDLGAPKEMVLPIYYN